MHTDEYTRLAVGDVPTAFGERYLPEARLGEGGMGMVFRVRDTHAGSVLALKTLAALRPVDLFHLKHEFRVARDLGHPNLIRLFDLVLDDEQCFFTMELVTGQDLLRYLWDDDDPRPPGTTTVTPFAKRAETVTVHAGGTLETFVPQTLHRPVPEFDGERLSAVMEQLLDGVEALHTVGVIHRDLKPSNVLVDADGRVVILDFGIALRGEMGAQEALRLAGTVAYMAPEQAMGEAVTAASDLYAVGVMLYEAVTGRLPFEGSGFRVLRDKVYARPLPVRSIAPAVPLTVARAIDDLLEAEPYKRPTLGELRRALSAEAAPLARSAPTPSTELLGRGEEFAALRGAWVEAQLGARVVFITGESGIGKTTLATHFCRRVADEALVLRGACHPQERVPFNALDAVVDQLSVELRAVGAAGNAALSDCTALTRLFPTMGGVPGMRRSARLDRASERERREGIVQLGRALAHAAGDRPLVCWIDDAQWADADSLAVFTQLIASSALERVMWLFSLRGPRVEELRSTLGGEDGPMEVALGALPGPELGELAQRTGLSRASLRDVAVRLSVGNPMLLRTLASHAAHGGELSGSAALQTALASSLQRLDAHERDAIELIAVAGAPVPLSVACPPDSSVHPSMLLKTLREGGLVRAAHRADTITVFHERLRAAIVAGLPAIRRRGLHGILAERLEAFGADAAILAGHFDRARRPAQARRHALEAAKSAIASLALDASIELARLGLRQETAGLEAPLHRVLGRALAAKGHSQAAADAYLAAARTSQSALDDRRQAAELLLSAGHLARGTQELDGVLRMVGLKLPPSRWRSVLELLWHRGRVRLRGLDFAVTPAGATARQLSRLDACWTVAGTIGYVDSVVGARFQAQHLTEALDTGNPRAVRRALATELVYALSAGGQEERVQRLEHGLATLHAYPMTEQDEAYEALSRGYGSFLCGDFPFARRELDRAIDLYARVGGTRWERRMARAQRLFVEIYLGNYPRLRALHDALSQDLRDSDDLVGEAMVRVAAGFLLDLLDDDPSVAMERIDSGLHSFPGAAPPTLEYLASWARTNVLLYQGRPADALWAADEAWRRSRAIRSFQAPRVSLLRLRGLAQAQLLEVGGGSLRKLRAHARSLRKEGAPWAHAFGFQLEAAAARHDTTRRIAQNGAVRSTFGDCEMQPWVHAEAFRNGDSDVAREADREMKRLGIAAPARWCRMFSS